MRNLILAEDYAAHVGDLGKFRTIYENLRAIFGVRESVSYTLVALYGEEKASELEADWA